MKRKFVSVVLAFLCVVGLLLVKPAYAVQPTVEIIPLENGDYIEVATTNSAVENRATLTKSGTVTYTYKTASGTAQWKADLFGRFQYNGFSAECLYSSCTVTIYNNAWSQASKTATYSGSTAYTTVAMNLRELGVVTTTRTLRGSLSCSPNGELEASDPVIAG